MASVIGKNVLNITRRSVLINTVRYKDKMMADPVEHATGLEKRELLAKLAGNEDPFNMRVIKRGAGTKTQPTQVPSVSEKRIIGCICEEDATSINWMWLHKGEPKRCECGYWFTLTDAKPV